MSETPTVRRPLGRWRREAGERGQILVLTAVSMTALLGIAALSIDASFMYDKRNRLYAAADAAARAGAIELMRGTETAEIWNFAKDQVEKHEFYAFDEPAFDDCSTEASNGVRLVINIPPVCEGPFQGLDGYVEAIVSESTGTFFAKVLGVLTMIPGARAVAGSMKSQECIVALGPTSSQVGTATYNLSGCDMTVGGNLTRQGSPTVSGGNVSTTGTCPSGVENCTSNSPPPSDPILPLFESDPPQLAWPTFDAASCQTIPAIEAALTLDPGCYNGITLDTGARLTLNPGTYILNGDFTTTNTNNYQLTGEGVTLYFASGTMDFTRKSNCSDGGAGCSGPWGVKLTAPTGEDDPYRGILFLKNTSSTVYFEGPNNVYIFSGIIYFPNSDVQFFNGFSATNDCSVMVVKSFHFGNGQGNLQFDNTCSEYGGSKLQTVALAE